MDRNGFRSILERFRIKPRCRIEVIDDVEYIYSLQKKRTVHMTSLQARPSLHVFRYTFPQVCVCLFMLMLFVNIHPLCRSTPACPTQREQILHALQIFHGARDAWSLNKVSNLIVYLELDVFLVTFLLLLPLGSGWSRTAIFTVKESFQAGRSIGDNRAFFKHPSSYARRLHGSSPLNGSSLCARFPVLLVGVPTFILKNTRR